jgi:hypothetical protein
MSLIDHPFARRWATVCRQKWYFWPAVFAQVGGTVLAVFALLVL